MVPIDIRVLISTNWKQGALVCKFGMFWELAKLKKIENFENSRIKKKQPIKGLCLFWCINYDKYGNGCRKGLNFKEFPKNSKNIIENTEKG